MLELKETIEFLEMPLSKEVDCASTQLHDQIIVHDLKMYLTTQIQRVKLGGIQ